MYCHQRPKEVTDGISCQHVDNMVFCSYTMHFSEVALFSFSFFFIKFYMKFEVVASQLLDKGSFHVLVVIVDALQLSCRLTGHHTFLINAVLIVKYSCAEQAFLSHFKE